MPKMEKQNESKVLLKVDDLCQYFKMGPTELKAVNHVSFEVHQGEVFGLVGESGCGKTTTGRSIIKLYDITSGNIYFDGRRIGAGTRSYRDAIRKAKADYKAGSISEDALHQIIAEQNENIKAAKFDNKNCNKQFAADQVRRVKQEYEPQLKKMDQEIAQAGANASQDLRNKRETLAKTYQKELALAKKDRIMNRIQMIFQDPSSSLDPRMTVRDIIAEGLVIRGVRDKKYIDEQVHKVLDLVGLVPEHASRYQHEFSGGQRQRIGIARAIVLNPELIIADEPISALDVSIQAQVINLLNDLRNRLGLTILFIAHDLSVVKYFSDKIGVMYFGNMVELAPSDELFAHPLHPYTKSLLSAIPVPDPEHEKNRKRIVYNPIAEHDYSVDQPTLREITPGHFIHCNEAEFVKYQAEIGNTK